MAALWRLATRLGVNMRFNYNGDHLRIRLDAEPMSHIMREAQILEKKHELTARSLNKIIHDRTGRSLEDFELEAFALDNRLHLVEDKEEELDDTTTPFELLAKGTIKSEDAFSEMCAELRLSASHHYLDRPKADMPALITELATNPQPEIPTGVNLLNTDHRRWIIERAAYASPASPHFSLLQNPANYQRFLINMGSN